jgi:hypothetical protein
MIHREEAQCAHKTTRHPWKGGKVRIPLIAAAVSLVGALACHSMDEVRLGAGGTAGGTPLEQGGSTGTEPDVRVPMIPECLSAGPTFIGVLVLGSLPASDPATPGTHELEGTIVGRAHGLPEAMSQLPADVASADAIGWVRIEPIASPDAGTPGDAGTRAGWTIVGPREIGDMAAPLGERVQISVEDVRASLHRGHFRVIARVGERVVLFNQESSVDAFGAHDGFQLTRGAKVCHEESPDGCIYSYRHELDVTVPGGASASLAPGESRTLGDYRVLHGDTSSILWRIESPNQGGGECNDIYERPSQVTAVFTPRP